MTAEFDEVKATQAAGMFLRLAGKPIDYLALIKLLYRTDREALRRWGLPVTTDKYASLRLGPITSNIYNLIKASANPAYPTFWSAYIKKSSAYTVQMAQDPGTSELSPAEERLIKEVFDADGDKSGFDLAEECHRDFPEWTDPGPSSSPISVSDIVEALGLSEEEAIHIEPSLSAQRAASKLAV